MESSSEYTSPYEPDYEDTYRDHPNCSQCGRPSPDWSGNIMVGREAWNERNVDQLRVWCKECTRDADNRVGITNVPHAIWELAWMKEGPAVMTDGVLRDLANPGVTRWSSNALEDFRHLVNMVSRPGQSALDR